jgi:CO/xanthine dehydrogenase Mo-binding subunit
VSTTFRADQHRAQAAAPAGTVGRPARRIGGLERVTGEQAFLADLRLEGMLHVKLVTLDCARARIDAIDTAAGFQVPGVVDVVTADDLPQPVPRFGPVYADRPILAVQETKYHGEAVAAVVAATRDAAEEAARRVTVHHQVLPAVLTTQAALAADAPLVQDPALRAGDPLARTNILTERHWEWGDVGAEAADLVIENTYTFPMVTHFAIEPHGAIAVAHDDGGLSIYSPVQHPYLLQRVMADLFDLPLTQVRVLAPDPGGGFGGKQNPKFEPLLAILARRTGHPCRLVLTLEETFQAVRRAAAVIHVRSGFHADGRIAYHDITSDYLLGAYADIGERVVTKANYLACGPYAVPAARIHARAIVSHTPPSTAFRGFGTPQINWAIESQLNEAANRLGLDGLAIRLRNLAAKGQAVVPGDFPADGHWEQSLRAAAEAVGWNTPLPPGRGRGIACGIKSGATTGLSYSTVRLLFDGSILVFAGTSDMGQGARTIFAQVAADEFGASLDKVRVIMGDTTLVPFDLQTSASRSTVFMGNAILDACRDIRRQVIDMAAPLYRVDPAVITVDRGEVHLPGRVIPLLDVVQRSLGRLRGEVIGNGIMRKPDMPDHPLGGDPAFYEFNCTAFEIEVDIDTGEIRIHKHIIAGDVGKALNPLQVESQDEGAAIMGLGHSLMEHLLLDDDGRIRNLGALDYRIPTSKDLPLEMHALMIENEDGPGPHGAKGISEGGLLCTASALSAAVVNATGVHIRDLPLTPERVWQHLHQSRTQANWSPRQSYSGAGGASRV